MTMSREYNYDILPEIQARYAARSFASTPVSREELLPLFEAARYAPSCFNEQPWRFLAGDSDHPETYQTLADTLATGNAWAKEAPVLILVLCAKRFRLNDKENAFARFDTGAATGFLQLEAVRRGFAVHSIAGFDGAKAREALRITDDLDIVDMIVLGRPVDPDTLPDEKKKQEIPGERNPLESFLL